MKNLHKLLLPLIVACCIHLSASAQNNAANDLIKQGIAFHNQGNYTDAVTKFNEALKVDPQNEYAHYELAFSLYELKKPTDAIPHLEIAAKSANKDLVVASYSLLASIYDQDNQSAKAFDIYNEAIKINPDYPQIYYNLGIAYSRAQRYPEAENAAIEAIKHNPKSASSQRLYALVCFHQNKRANALMGLCSFILLEPTGARAAEAYGNIQHILQGGVLKDANGKTTLQVSLSDQQEISTFNMAISMAMLSAQTKGLAGLALLEYQLKTTFGIVGELSAKKADKSFFDKFFVDYFYKLSQTNYMPALTHTIALTDPKADNANWGKQNTDQINGMATWLQNTPRGY
ncbi:tetratricopeptide repeat protein [Mucilaginibacter jinjuensis]|uniref:Tetratricopeptide repeat protein n=1 Tax=Mucilaginibacter jinjuensis TaxID=1176721 RepID=A0ABY7TAK3_9SPHI|nr:tetratricopeptide repeat protein [Mucilaginibacter jinjuensis]WCT13530.1 tetratricopeptide repeat protein [Mucilaginibacter jinjuensis]